MSTVRPPRRGLVLPSEERGVTLIEIMVTILILGIGLMGMASLQIHSLRSTLSADHFTQVNTYFSGIQERMRANAAEARAGSYNIDLGDEPAGAGQILADLQAWKTELATNLPGGDGGIDCATTGICTVTIRWIGDVATGATLQFSTESLI